MQHSVFRCRAAAQNHLLALGLEILLWMLLPNKRIETVLVSATTVLLVIGKAGKIALPPRRKLLRELHRIGMSLRRQLWLLRKKRRLQAGS